MPSFKSGWFRPRHVKVLSKDSLPSSPVFGDVVRVLADRSWNITAADDESPDHKDHNQDSPDNLFGAPDSPAEGAHSSSAQTGAKTPSSKKQQSSQNSFHQKWATQPFLATVIAEEDEADPTIGFAIVPHDAPKSMLRARREHLQFVCGASRRTNQQHPTNPPNTPLFMTHSKNGLDFLAEGTVLKDYQILGVDWITRCWCDRGGCILADDMGLGKTLQALAFLANLEHGEMGGPFLIVVPCAVVGNWLRELKKFCPHLHVAKVAGTRQEQEYVLDNAEIRYGERDVYVTTYETLVSNESFFASIVWNCVILDEAHRIKNQVGRVRATLGHIETVFRLLLTGRLLVKVV